MSPLIGAVLFILVLCLIVWLLLYLFNTFFAPSDPALAKMKSVVNVVVWVLVLIWILYRLAQVFGVRLP